MSAENSSDSGIANRLESASESVPIDKDELAVRFLRAEEWRSCPAILESWERLLDSTENPNELYQSPVWMEHLCATGRSQDTWLALIQGRSGDILGVVPLLRQRQKLRFGIGARTLLQASLDSMTLLGSQPLLPADHHVYEAFISALFTAFPTCNAIYLDAVRRDTFCWQHLRAGDHPQRNHFVHSQEGLRLSHTLPLPTTFEEYLSQFSRKKRHNLRNEVSRLRDRTGGNLELLRIDSAAMVETFLQHASEISSKSWQFGVLGARIQYSLEQRANLVDLANRGLLRSYLLRCGEDCVAFGLGYSYRGMFHYVETGYDARYSQYSPGTVLLFLFLEDLIAHRPLQTVNFGIGDAEYKQQFRSIGVLDESLMILRRTARNALLHFAHLGYRRLVALAKASLAFGQRFRKK